MSVAAGWYDDGSGRLRWWDGAQWTEHFAPQPPADAAAEQVSAEQVSTESTPEQVDLDATVLREEIPATAPETAPEAHDTPVTPEAPAAPVAEAPTTPAAEEYSAPVAPSAPTPDAAPIAPTEQYPPYAAPAPTYPGAPQQQAPAYAATQPGQPYAAPYAAAPAEQGPKKTPVIGFISLGLAVVGTILACIPPFVWLVGFFLLFVALVLGIVGLFIKNTAKWPSITGLVLSVVGTVIGGIVGSFVLFATIAANTETMPIDSPTSVETTDSRPSPEAITEGFLIVMNDIDIHDFDDPAVAGCIGEYMYESDLSDETLTTIAGGDDIYSPVEEATHVSQVTAEAITECMG